MTSVPLIELYKQRGLQKDPQQMKALASLERLHSELMRTPKKGLFGFGKTEAPKGVYIYGEPGRGKSMLMDLFFQNLPDNLPKRRVHFHEFMIETHDWLHQARGAKVDNLLPLYADAVAKNVRVLCFDEFYVTDVADAMILSRLFTALLEKGVTGVVTSNWPPDRLYEGGLQRDLFMPFIDFIKDNAEIVHLDSAMDFRTTFVKDYKYYFFPLGPHSGQKIDTMFNEMTGGDPPILKKIVVKGRNLLICCCDGVARSSFADLCERPHGAEDFLNIAGQFHTIFLEGVPKLGNEKRNELKRFMNLVDVLYDKGKRLVISADAAPDRLYYGHDHEAEFQRTVSRLREMQSSSYPAHPVQ